MELSRFIVLSTLLISSSQVMAQCVNTANPSCGVYESCFADRCHCDNSQYEYFKSYGEKYCKVFIDLPGLSQKGKEWRNATMKCLQETIVPILPADGKADTCNCQNMQKKAFDSHVQCYTQPSKSICDLDISDWVKITLAIDPIASIQDKQKWDQMLAVAKICFAIAPADKKSTIKQVIDKLEK